MQRSNNTLGQLAAGRAKTRRKFILQGVSSLLAAAAVRRVPAAAPLASAPQRSASVTIENFSAAGLSLGRVEVTRVVKTDEEWRKLLSPLAYEVTRAEGTERAFSGEYDRNHLDGCTGASAVTRHCLIRARSSTPAPAGRASGNRSRGSMWSKDRTAVSACRGSRCRAVCAMPISATCLMTDRDRRACATA
jgi:hypothetical protein